MEILTPIPPKIEPSIPDHSPKRPPNFGYFLLLLVAIVVLMATFDDFTIKKPDGTYDLAAERKAELERRKKQLDNAEQYVLKATQNGYYPCHNCGKETKIYLYLGEVWKYGVSINGSKRYKRWWYLENNLTYQMQFKGSISECRKMELDKIYYYPLLPKNLKRDYKLPRPPGNKEDY